MGGDVILGPMSEERYISGRWQAPRSPILAQPNQHSERAKRATSAALAATRPKAEERRLRSASVKVPPPLDLF